MILDRVAGVEICFSWIPGELLRKLDYAVLPALGDLEHILSVLKGQIPDDELAQLQSFMKRCLAIDPDSRPSAEELLRDPFLTR